MSFSTLSTPWLVLLHLHCFCFVFSLCLSSTPDVKTLQVGKELEEESMPLRSGRRIYKVLGLKESTWYEVKISYPASIPTSFTIELVKNAPEFQFGKNRRLLNTEKLIFRVDNSDSEEVFVLVNVEAEGVVAIPNAQERELVIYNIVCDELMLGIPLDAWYVGIGALLCLLPSGQERFQLSPHDLPSFVNCQSTSEELNKPIGTSSSTKITHPLKLLSSYASVKDSSGTRDLLGEPIATSYHSKFLGTVDYIWHSSGLACTRVLDTLPLEALKKLGSLPCKDIGSDHLALAAELKFTNSTEFDQEVPTKILERESVLS